MTENTEVAELRAQLAECQRIISAQAETIAESRRLLGACESHNEMVLGRLKLANAQPVDYDPNGRGKLVGYFVNVNKRNGQPPQWEQIADQYKHSDPDYVPLYTAPQPAEPVKEVSDEAIAVLKLALEYWADRQQRYKNRSPVWVTEARALLASYGKAAQPASSAEPCKPCNGNGIVGNILNAQPCPDCTPPADGQAQQAPCL